MEVDTPSRPLSPPAAGKIRLYVENGFLRAIDSNGRVMRIQPEPGTPNHAAAAEQLLTVSSQPTAGNVLTLDNRTWTFVSGTPAANEIQIGANLAASQTNIRAAINASGDFACTAFGSNQATVSAVLAGAQGNVRCFITATGSNGFAGSTLTGGVYATTASKGDRMFDSPEGDNWFFASRDIGKHDTTGWNVVAATDL